MHDQAPAYGLWSLVILNSLVFIIFAFSFAPPANKRDWRSLGAFSAFVIALMTEMYGVPLTIYFLAGWLGSRYPGLDLYSHQAGHLWHTMFRMRGDAHFDVFHLLSFVFIIGGFWLLSAAWKVLHRAQQQHALATEGPYAWVRHPQYDGFIAIMLGFLLQWPTLLTLFMFPVLVVMYVRLARHEEREVRAAFGEAYDRYASAVPAFLPRPTAPASARRPQ